MTDHLPDTLPPSPLPLFKTWLDDAVTARVSPNPDAFVLATASVADGAATPACRVVLCKQVMPDPGYLVFYTNYDSGKGRELDQQPRAAANFFWDTAGRQVRITGPVVKSPGAESDTYFQSRSWQSRLGACASAQSQPIASRQAMHERVKAAWREHDVDYPHGDGARAQIARPPGWGGFRLWAETVELWISGSARVHDRARWIRPLEPDGPAFAPGAWRSTRLQP